VIAAWPAALLAALALAWPAAGRGAEAAAVAGDDPRARAYFTDTALLDQDGARVRFYSDALAGRTVAIAFVFTRCRGACPLIMEKLNLARARLGDAFGREIHFVAISVDPSFDTPVELKKFSREHGAQGPGWTLLTGKPDEVRLILRKLGAEVDDPGEHSTVIYAGNTRSRHWTRIRPDAGPPLVASTLLDLAAEPSAAAAAR